jgi:DnaJ-domain-containing protein 1
VSEYEELVSKAKEYDALAGMEKSRELKKKYKDLARDCWRKALRLKYNFGEGDSY